jgi:hypothetical protein
MSGNGERYFSKRSGPETSRDVTVAIAVRATTRLPALRWQFLPTTVPHYYIALSLGKALSLP